MRWFWFIGGFLFFVGIVLLAFSFFGMEPVDYEPVSNLPFSADVNESLNETEEIVVEEEELNETGNETEVLEEVEEEVNDSYVEEIVYGDAVAKGNDTYMFKINDQINISGSLIRVERILPSSVLVFVNGDREQTGLFGLERMGGLNITLVEVFYDSIASGRLAYLRIL